MSPDRIADPPVTRAKVAVFGEHDDKTLAQLRDVASRADRAALMADGHLGYVMPIGGVAAYRDTVSVVGVGFDIACGNAAIRTDLTFEKNLDVITRLPSIADEIQDAVSFGMGRKNRANDAPIDHPLFDSPSWDAIPEMMEEWIRQKGVILRGGGLDESPHVYRRLPDVLAAQKGTIEVLHMLRPLIVIMAGPDQFDPYRD